MPFAAEGQDAMMRAIQDCDYDEAALEEIELSGAGMDFIESLLRINPVERMSGQAASKHPWITSAEFEYNLQQETNINNLRVNGDSSAAFGYDPSIHWSQAQVAQLDPSAFARDSRFSVDSSAGFLASSKYVSAASHQHDSNATITPTRQRQGLFKPGSLKKNWFKKEGRLFQSEPAIN